MLQNVAELFHKMIINKSFTLGAITGLIGTFFDAVLRTDGFKELHGYISVLLAIIIILDYTVGVRVAKKKGIYASHIGIDAVIRDGVIFLMVAMGWIFDQLLGTGALIFAVLAFAFIYHNFQSFVANLYVLGWDKYFPMWLFRIVESEIKAKINKYKEQN